MWAAMWLACRAASPPAAADPAETGAADTATAADTAATPVLPDTGAAPWVDVPLRRERRGVQPMTGLVVWADDWRGHPVKDVVQLEYAYVAPDRIVTGPDTYDWTSFDALLDDVSSRGHQAIVRLYYVYPGRPTAVPAWIKALPDYEETVGRTEGQTTSFPDWRSPELQQATLDLWSALAARYDDDPRLAFVQAGFGLWGEYHIYDGPMELGRTFPNAEYQATFLRHLDAVLDDLPVSVSIDAGDPSIGPLSTDPSLGALTLGLFDDSFMHAQHDRYNAEMFARLGVDDRALVAPIGGELSYYTLEDQQHALDEEGLHGRTFEQLSAQYHVSYMIGNDQPRYQSVERIDAASQALGYALRITRHTTNGLATEVEVVNEGIAPLYVDAWVAVGGVRGEPSLRGLAPGASRVVSIAASGGEPEIACDRLVAGQQIGYAADL